MENNFTARIVHLEETYSISHNLALQIMRSENPFDVVVAIALGGMLPARLLCDFLNIKPLTSMQIRHYESGAQQMEQAKVVDPVDVDIQDKNVLIVDDVNDSGETLQAAVDHIRNLKPRVFRTAVLHEKAGTSFKADYVGKKQIAWKWLIYDWALTEDVLEFLNKGDMLNKSANEVQTYLSANYNLTIEKKRITDILAMKGNYF